MDPTAIPQITWQDARQMPEDGNRYEATGLPVQLGSDLVGTVDLAVIFAPRLHPFSSLPDPRSAATI